MTDAPPFSRVREIVARACRLDGEQRKGFLGEMCAQDPRLRREVESLLAFQDDTAGPVKTGQFSPRAAAQDTGMALGSVIGEYELVGLLGEGGMGTVYEARQPSRERSVALKVIRSGWIAETTERHFGREIEALGRLQHPSIATIYEAGKAMDGRPYYAMELVRGLTLADYSGGIEAEAQDSQRLRQPIGIIADVCDAIDHAHRQGVIHRDIKPTNIMVVPSPGQDEPASSPDTTLSVKVLDFGLARLSRAERSRGEETQTALGDVKGTLAYMSPEQVSGRTQELDFRTDVYSLGVVLYELVAGRLPYARKPTSLAEALQLICEEAPIPLRRVRPTVGDGLEAILLKALQKDPGDRYQSAADFADDLRRFLDDHPISAQRPGFAKQARNLVARTADAGGLGVLAIVAAGVTVCVAIGVSLSVAAGLLALMTGLLLLVSWFSFKLRRFKRSAEQEALKAKSLASFLEQVLVAPHPLSEGSEVTIRQVVDQAAERIDSTPPAVAEVEGLIRRVLGNVYVGLEEDEAASAQLERAIQLLTQSQGADGDDTCEAKMSMTHVAFRRGDLARTESLLLEVLRASSKKRGPDHAETMQINSDLGFIYSRTGRIRAAIELMQKGVAARERLHGQQHYQTVVARELLAGTLLRNGQYEESEREMRKVLDARDQIHQTEHQRYSFFGNYCRVLATLGRSREALDYCDRALEILDRDVHPKSWIHTCASTLLHFGHLDRAREITECLLRIIDEEGQAASGTKVTARLLLAQVQSAEGDLGGSDREYEAIIEDLAATQGTPAHVANARLGLAQNALKRGDASTALALLDACDKPLREGLEDPHPTLDLVRLDRAASLVALGAPDEARETLGSLSQRKAPPGWWHPVAARWVEAWMDVKLGGAGAEASLDAALRDVAERSDVPRPRLDLLRAMAAYRE